MRATFMTLYCPPAGLPPSSGTHAGRATSGVVAAGCIPGGASSAAAAAHAAARAAPPAARARTPHAGASAHA